MAFVDDKSLSIVTFNILAKSWAQPLLYYDSNRKYLLDEGSDLRLKKNITCIKHLAYRDEDPVTVFGLQETERLSFKSIVKALNKKTNQWVGFQCFHLDDYWSEYDPPEGLDIIRRDTGVGLIFRTDLFTFNGTYIRPGIYESFVVLDDKTKLIFNVRLGHLGNRAIFIDNMFYIPMAKTIRLAVVHFDSCSSDKRYEESKSIADFFTSEDPNHIYDILLGDFNTSLDDKIFSDNLEHFNVTPKYRKQTHPFTDRSYIIDNYIEASASNNVITNTITNFLAVAACIAIKTISGQIDHIITSSGFIIDCKGSDVVDFDLWNTYPQIGTRDKNEEARINANFELSGSDHFPVMSKLILSCNPINPK